jgi:hypothetical protein
MAMDLAYCGLDCGACPAYHALERLTVEQRQEVADKWNVDYAGTLTVEDIDCVGCSLAEGHQVPYCAECEIRGCARDRAVATCAECADYGCAKLSGFLASSPEAKANLEALRPA